MPLLHAQPGDRHIGWAHSAQQLVTTVVASRQPEESHGAPFRQVGYHPVEDTATLGHQIKTRPQLLLAKTERKGGPAKVPGQLGGKVDG
ncbi:MAG: hypothetical protein DCC55_11705 [Chloroflexi bacterium]|nr:MAG: hypothetical protein DCC55_11705 [Chloroflexota bacterium]